jgi:hypothetical protein
MIGSETTQAGMQASAQAAAQTGGAGSGGGGKQILELRRYTFASPQKREAFENFIGSGMIPALNRQGIQPVGAFKMLRADNPQAAFDGDTGPDLFVLLPHNTMDSVLALEARLAADTTYGKVLAALKDEPKDAAYLRYQSLLMLAFDDCPKVEVPTRAAGRVLQLRVYESHNAERGALKVRMFNEGGEIRIFREVGMNPVFFGQAFSGEKLPNLTYLLGFEDEATMKSAWDKFGKHPDWEKLKNEPRYKDTVSNITNIVLRPVTGSQV